jgi:hypothetical protein
MKSRTTPPGAAVRPRHLRWSALRSRRRHRFQRSLKRRGQSEATRRQNAELAARPPDRFGNGRRLGEQWPYIWWRH